MSADFEPASSDAGFFILKTVIRLTGGVFKGRKLLGIRQATKVRPTQSIVRQTLFNWLYNDLRGFQCLDLFAGSGALSWEALSRGADSLVLVDKSPILCIGLRRQADLLNATHKTSVFCQDVIAWLQKSSKNLANNQEHLYDLIFLDPPYSENLLLSVLSMLSQKTFLKRRGLIYYEAKQPLRLSDQMEQVFYSYKNSRHGKTFFGLLRYQKSKDLG